MAVAIDVVGTEVLSGAGLASPRTYTGLTTGGSLSNGCVTFIVCFGGNAKTGLAATWDGVACTLIASINTGGGFGTTTVWGLSPIGTHTGNKTFSISWTDTADQTTIQGQSWTGADQTGGTTTFNHNLTATGNSGTASGAITSATGDAVLAGFSVSGDTFTGTSGTNIFIENGAANTGTAGLRDAGAASVTVSGTILFGSNWGVAGTNIKQSGGAAFTAFFEQPWSSFNRVVEVIGVG